MLIIARRALLRHLFELTLRRPRRDTIDTVVIGLVALVHPRTRANLTAPHLEPSFLTSPTTAHLGRGRTVSNPHDAAAKLDADEKGVELTATETFSS